MSRITRDRNAGERSDATSITLRSEGAVGKVPKGNSLAGYPTTTRCELLRVGFSGMVFLIAKSSTNVCELSRIFGPTSTRVAKSGLDARYCLSDLVYLHHSPLF